MAEECLMIRDQLLAILSGSRTGESTRSLTEALSIGTAAEDQGIVEAILLLSPECRKENDRWLSRGESRAARLLSEIRAYADATGKRIFRLSSALKNVSANEHPTSEELTRILQEAGGEFELLPNAMVKKVTS